MLLVDVTAPGRRLPRGLKAICARRCWLRSVDLPFVDSAATDRRGRRDEFNAVRSLSPPAHRWAAWPSARYWRWRASCSFCRRDRLVAPYTSISGAMTGRLSVDGPERLRVGARSLTASPADVGCLAGSCGRWVPRWQAEQQCVGFQLVYGILTGCQPHPSDPMTWVREPAIRRWCDLLDSLGHPKPGGGGPRA